MTNPTMLAPAKVDTPNLTTLINAIGKADKGDTKALDLVRDVFRENSGLAERISSLAYNAEAAILMNVAPGAQELFREQASNLRRELRDEGTGTALEAMLIRRIALDYMASLQADWQRALAPGERRSLELTRLYDQQADRAHRRFLASVESLARVRKLITPIQINIAEQQVNLAGSMTARKGTRLEERP